MDNLSKIKKISKNMHLLFSAGLVCIPLYYVLYWFFINDLPQSFINVNTSPVPLVRNELSSGLRLAGFLAGLLPLSALFYIVSGIRRLFAYYQRGEIFSFGHVDLFKKTARGLLAWVFLSMLYDSVKSIIFSAGNPPGSRVVTVSFSTAEMTTLVTGVMVLIIAWVMDEGRVLNEEKELTI